jgi:hypothetical protein
MPSVVENLDGEIICVLTETSNHLWADQPVAFTDQHASRHREATMLITAPPLQDLDG